MSNTAEVQDEMAAGCPAGRRVAGEDPAKREQIIEGAKRVFMQGGFDAVSMNDITKEAGVSKGTIYVYFENKEDLFAAMIQQERSRIVATVKHVLDEDKPLRETLMEFGVTLASHITADHTIRAMRIVLGVTDRMPQLACGFFGATPENGHTVLHAFLERKVEAGELSIPDTDLASRQFIEMAMAGMFKQRLFGVMTEPPTRELLEYTVSSAADVFLKSYLPEHG
ncbi:AcrR family transcriptional regulator [Pararhizobium capsulatum DSM 1112]|uniref:AcrR family transcriptional regulator n=2 Tax=Pararhizobium capsulatum TaxID=34014 RepID=A0ABU0BUH6_9HYPH|nr:AcrR family transcriptional regulator [Pararhizobium capsulatum DSM 1112]